MRTFLFPIVSFAFSVGLAGTATAQMNHQPMQPAQPMAKPGGNFGPASPGQPSVGGRDFGAPVSEPGPGIGDRGPGSSASVPTGARTAPTSNKSGATAKAPTPPHPRLLDPTPQELLKKKEDEIAAAKKAIAAAERERDRLNDEGAASSQRAMGGLYAAMSEAQAQERATVERLQKERAALTRPYDRRYNYWVSEATYREWEAEYEKQVSAIARAIEEAGKPVLAIQKSIDAAGAALGKSAANRARNEALQKVDNDLNALRIKVSNLENEERTLRYGVAISEKETMALIDTPVMSASNAPPPSSGTDWTTVAMQTLLGFGPSMAPIGGVTPGVSAHQIETIPGRPPRPGFSGTNGAYLFLIAALNVAGNKWLSDNTFDPASVAAINTAFSALTALPAGGLLVAAGAGVTTALTATFGYGLEIAIPDNTAEAIAIKALLIGSYSGLAVGAGIVVAGTTTPLLGLAMAFYGTASGAIYVGVKAIEYASAPPPDPNLLRIENIDRPPTPNVAVIDPKTKQPIPVKPIDPNALDGSISGGLPGARAQ